MLPGETCDVSIREDDAMSDLPKKRTRGMLPKKFASYTLQKIDTAISQWHCEVCQQKLSSKESLRRHVLACHIKQAVHHCHLCTSSFVLKFQLLHHLRTIHSSEPDANSHPCICGRVFSRRNSLLCHIKRVHHPAPLERPVCTTCGKTFYDKAALRTHHAQVHALASIPCPYPGCDKLFRTLGLRNAHYRYHEQRQYCCNICDKSFSTRSYRDKHELTHSGVRQYVCGLCGVACITASQLGTHTKRRHPSQQLPVREATICGGAGMDHRDDCKVQDADDPMPVEALLGDTNVDSDSLGLNSNDSNCARSQSSSNDQHVTSDHSVPHALHTPANLIVSSAHNVPIDNNHSDRDSFRDNSDLDISSFDFSHLETNSSFHNLSLSNELFDSPFRSLGTVFNDNSPSDHNSSDRILPDANFSFDDALLNDYNLSI